MNDVICTYEELIPSILIEDHHVIGIQNVTQLNENKNHGIKMQINSVGALPSEKKFHSPELLIIYVVLVLLVVFTLYQHLRHRHIIHKLNEVNNTENLNTSSSKQQRAIDMNATTQTSHYPSVSPSETINSPDKATVDNPGSRKPRDGSVDKSINTPITILESQSTKMPQPSPKEEIKRDKFSYDERINFRYEMERLNRQIKREHEENRDNFAAFVKANLELKIGLETVVIAMGQLASSLIGQEREIYELHVKNLNVLLRQWKNILEDYEIVEIIPTIGEEYRKYEKSCILDKEAIDTDDPQKDETIAKVLEKGYRLESRVLYQARVCIYKYKPVVQNPSHQ